MITASHYKTIRPKTWMFATEATAPAIIILAGWRFDLLPNVAPAHGALASAALIWTLVFLCLCSMTIALMQRRPRTATNRVSISSAEPSETARK